MSKTYRPSAVRGSIVREHASSRRRMRDDEYDKISTSISNMVFAHLRRDREENLHLWRYSHILGFGGAGVLAQTLGCIMWFCEKNKLPALTVLVVNQDTGLPGEGLTTIEDVNTDRKAVFNFAWFGVEPSQNEDFERVDKNKP